MDHSSQNPISAASSSSSSADGPGQVVGNHMSPIGQRHTPGDTSFYSQHGGAEDNGNDTSICRPNQKASDGNDMVLGTADDNANQQSSILEKALAKQDQALLTAQVTPLSNNSSIEWSTPPNGESQHMNQSGRGNTYSGGGPDARGFMMKQEIDSPTIGDYMQHYHHHGHHETSNGPSHDPLSNPHHQVYTNSATLHIPGGAEDHQLIRHSSPTVSAGADQYHSSSKHHHAPPWVR